MQTEDMFKFGKILQRLQPTVRVVHDLQVSYTFNSGEWATAYFNDLNETQMELIKQTALILGHQMQLDIAFSVQSKNVKI